MSAITIDISELREELAAVAHAIHEEMRDMYEIYCPDTASWHIVRQDAQRKDEVFVLTIDGLWLYWPDAITVGEGCRVARPAQRKTNKRKASKR